MQVPHISLIPFSEKGEDVELRQLLSALGYEVRVIPPANWLVGETKSVTDISILLLACPNLSPERIVTRLLEDKASTWFALLKTGVPDWDSKILEQCHEVGSWPCHQQALRRRLEKLYQQRSTNTMGAWEADDQECVRLNLVGRDPLFLRKLDFTRKIGQCDAPVVIQGETGTGKELFARALHYLGTRRDNPFVPVNCGAIPDTLLENELFGHERGAFTDAHNRQPGLVSQAHNGTLFLDEVDTLSPKAQVALLRFLQDQVYQPLGGAESSRANVRVIAASNSDLAEQVRRQQFRRDLFYRLKVLSLTLPPLRNRRSDIPLLAEHFLRQISARNSMPSKTIHPRVLRWMCQYEWPGNVRELENFLQRCMIMSEGPVLDQILSDLEETGEGEVDERQVHHAGELQFSQAKATAIADFEKNYLVDLMKEFQGNVSRAATRAGKERRAFGKLLKKHGIGKEEFLPKS